MEHGSARTDSTRMGSLSGEGTATRSLLEGDVLGLPQVLASSKGTEPLDRGKLRARKGAAPKKPRKRGRLLGGQ